MIPLRGRSIAVAFVAALSGLTSGCATPEFYGDARGVDASGDITISALQEENIDAYLSRFSAVQGGSIDLHVSTYAESFDIEVKQLGLINPTIRRKRNIPGVLYDTPDNSWSDGPGWPVAFTLPITADWPSGTYAIKFDTGEQVVRRHFLVLEDDPGSTASILVVDTAPTEVAYNTWGGKSAYGGPNRGAILSLQRPGQNDWDRGLFNFMRWLELMNIDAEWASMMDLHYTPEILDHYGTLVIVGHSEYWSREQRDAFDAFIDRGGSAIILSGNTMWWQVRFDEANEQMIIYKSDAENPIDPLHGVNDPLVTTRWRDPPVNYPENSSIGVTFRSGGVITGEEILPISEGYGGFTIVNQQHRFFAGTGLSNGDILGTDDLIAGNEVDGAELVCTDGTAPGITNATTKQFMCADASLPMPTGTDSTPLNYEVLALSAAETGGWTGNGAPGYFERGENGGRVFNTATINWPAGLRHSVELGDLNDPLVSKIVLNVLAEMAPESGASCAYGTTVTIDSDGDKVNDACDNCVLQKNPNQPDKDKDGTGNKCDSIDNRNNDIDGDGMPDAWESNNGLNLSNPHDAEADPDGDDLVNLSEFANRTNPSLADTDGDWLKDGYEITVAGTNPKMADSDADSLNDFAELSNGLDPLNSNDALEDADGDGLSNADEVMIYGSNPVNPDTDGDWLQDGVEASFTETNLLNPDSDSDGMNDFYEAMNWLDPNNDTAADDADNDGYSNLVEHDAGSNPRNPDSVP